MGKQIQFIGYVLDTAPKNPDIRKIDGNSIILSGEYVGLADISQDIQARCNLMMDAIKTAKQKLPSPTDDSILKIFMAPEFFFRGPKGAYQMGEVGTVIDTLQEMVKDTDWKNWMFVFGTILGTWESEGSTPPAKSTVVYNFSLVQNGGWLADVPQELIDKGKDAPDGSEAATALANAMNAARSNNARVIQKEHMSSIDFIILPNPGGLSYMEKLKERMDHLKGGARAPGKEQQTGKEVVNYSGLGIFEINDITFALDICLDHGAGRLAQFPLTPGGNQVQVQLIPSCGMTIEGGPLVVRSGGYAFNVDGIGPGSHSVLRKVGIPPSDKKTKATEKVVPSKFSPPVAVSSIFATDAGNVLIYEVVAIPDQEKIPGYYLKFTETVFNGYYIFHYYIYFDRNKDFQQAFMSIDAKLPVKIELKSSGDPEPSGEKWYETDAFEVLKDDYSTHNVQFVINGVQLEAEVKAKTQLSRKSADDREISFDIKITWTPAYYFCKKVEGIQGEYAIGDFD